MALLSFPARGGRLVRFEPSDVPSPRRRVLFVTNMWPDEERPWYGTFINTQAQSLAALDVAVDVLYMRGYLGPQAYAAAFPAVPLVARRGRYDVVHAHYGHSAAVGRLHRGAPYVISYCGTDLLGTPVGEVGTPMTRKSAAEARVFRRLAHVADATITKSEEMERELPERCRAKNHVIPNGVDLSRFREVGRDQARHALGWDTSEAAVLFVGNPELPRKNHPLAERVVRQVADVMPNVRLRVAWGIDPAEIPTWMNAADVLLFPSQKEGSPNVVKEAMAAALPIVATPVGDVEERLRGLPGCFVRPAEEEPLADGVVQALRHGRAEEARAAVAELSLERVAERIDGVYDLVTGAAGHHRSGVGARPR